MPRLSTWFIRASLVYLALGFTLGGLLLFNKGFPRYPFFWSLLPSHIEFVLFGWTAQLAMGTAFWILPRFSSPPLRGDEKPVWIAFFLMNAGIWSLVLASFFSGSLWFTLTGRLAQAAGILAFARHAWPRIKGFRSS